ncbi:MAG: hypothetical protein KGL35_20720, partial [Bradyrhizobium sp.]|nr:hypothetical protein [Bradyrhizobium sp.]
KALATAYGCNEIETAELLDTLGTPAPTKARAQTSGVVLPIAPPAGQPIQDWHTRLVRMASFATTAARAGMTPADLAELLAFIGQPQRGDTPEDATLAYVAQALDEFGAPPADIEQLRRAVHRVVDQWLDWTRKRRGTMLVEVSGMEGAK